MTRSFVVLAALLAVLILGSPAEADLYSPAVELSAGDWIACVVANIKSYNLTVRIQIKDASGTIVEEITSPMGPEDLATHGATTSSYGTFHCVFIGATKSNARAAAQHYSAGRYRYSIPAR